MRIVNKGAQVLPGRIADELDWKVMLEIIDLRGTHRLDPTVVGTVLPRPPKATYATVKDTVAEIMGSVATEGDQAIARYAQSFDQWEQAGQVFSELGTWKVPPALIDEAVTALDPALRTALETAIAQVQWFHTQAKPTGWEGVHHHARMGVRFTPVSRAGVYVPGGRAAYPSTVIMTVVPALVAGVDDIVMCTPPGPDGRPNQTILAAAGLVGIHHVYRIGGAQAIAAMAHGTDTLPAVDVIVGPGNAYVNEAKLQAQASGLVGIDAPAGVSEVMLVADDSADPVCVATSLIAQAEHDPMVTSILVTPSDSLAQVIPGLVEEELATLETADRIRQALFGQGAIVLVDDLDHAVDVADAFAPEHLEVQTEDAVHLAEAFTHAGTIFIGVQTPTAFGDYCAGPNHTLPTNGAARFTGGLTTSQFMKPVNYVEFSPDASTEMAEVVRALGGAEGLPAHVRSVQARIDRLQHKEHAARTTPQATLSQDVPDQESQTESQQDE
ncbi:histidinol dehydrogenase [Stomatohabitans albus]|uniref:histidinol dehydrogenase n=1 Tax=Stomatohabitans albus TaxID=3110766 RepID=UPI00300C1E89